MVSLYAKDEKEIVIKYTFMYSSPNNPLPVWAELLLELKIYLPKISAIALRGDMIIREIGVLTLSSSSP